MKIDIIYRDEQTSRGIWADITRILVSALSDIAVKATLATPATSCSRHPIIMTPHLYSEDELKLFPEGSTAFNWENLESSSHLTESKMRALSRFSIWDYSRRNVQKWATLGIEAFHVPLGFHSSLLMQRPTRKALGWFGFFGALNPRRASVLSSSQAFGIPMVVANNLYGDTLRAFLSTLPAALNVHYYTPGILEISRLLPLWANGIPTITEVGPDTDQPIPLHLGNMGCLFPEIPTRMLEVIHNPSAAIDTADDIQSQLRKYPASESLERGLNFTHDRTPTQRVSRQLRIRESSHNSAISTDLKPITDASKRREIIAEGGLL